MTIRFPTRLVLAVLSVAPIAAMAASIEQPLSATLLPAVQVTARASQPLAAPTMTVADTAPQQVTLLPTLRVEARVEAPVLLPLVRVYATTAPTTNEAIAWQAPARGWQEASALPSRSVMP